MAETETHLTKQESDRGKTKKHFTNFLYKASLALTLLVIIPLIPSQAPEFINQTVPSRSWELLHLVLVGIAVSYGLFSSRNQGETEKEPDSSKFDSPQSFVSRLLQVPSVSDDEHESVSSSSDDVTKLETWSSQYVRNEPVVVLAKEQNPTVINQQRVSSVGSRSPRTGEKPLLLPVRSLKSRVSDEPKEPIYKNSGVSTNPSFTRSFSDSGSRKTSKKLGRSEEKTEENESVVLPSPIPWRSRSGRMVVTEDLPSTPVSPFSSSMEDLDNFRAKPEASKPQISAPFRLNSGSRISFSPKKPHFSSELQAKTAEDFLRKKSFQKHPPPPPPPPPPAMFKSSSTKTRLGSGSNNDGISSNKDLGRSYSGIEMKPRSSALQDGGKSVRTFRARKDFDFAEPEESEEMNSIEKTRKMTDFNPKLGFFEIPEGFVEDVISDSDEELPANENGEEKAEVGNLNLKNEEEVGNSKNEEVDGGGPDVDKKADEFIAKFREQIRLQRIDSIKRSTAEISRSLSR